MVFRNSPIQRLIVMSSQLLHDMLYAQHEELVPKVQPEFQRFLAWPIAENGVDKRHNCRFQANLIPVFSSRAVQVVDDALRTNLR